MIMKRMRATREETAGTQVIDVPRPVPGLVRDYEKLEHE